MIEAVESFAASAADQRHAARWAAQAGIAFAHEKRRVDAECALASVQGHAKTELINALRNLAQQLRP
jgi:hypothetical protein